MWKVVPNLYLSHYVCHRDSIWTTWCPINVLLAFIDEVFSFSVLHELLMKYRHIPRESENCILHHVHHKSLLWGNFKSVFTCRSLSIVIWYWEAEDCIRYLKHSPSQCTVYSSPVPSFGTCAYIDCPIIPCVTFCL